MTAVEWLEKELLKNGYVNKGYHNQDSLNHLEGLLEQAKQREKQQIIDAYYGYELYLDREFRFQQGGQAKILTFDQWYETYASKGSDETKQ